MIHLKNNILTSALQKLCIRIAFSNAVTLRNILCARLVHCHIRGFMRSKHALIILGDILFKFIITLTIPSSYSNWNIRVFICFPLATKWKYLVLASPFNKCVTSALWYHFTSFSRSRWDSHSFKTNLRFGSFSSKGRSSAFSSNSSNLFKSCLFFFSF
jgi:hypothetical protein